MLKSNKQTFTTKEIKINQSKAKKLFVKRPTWQSLLIVSLPGLVVVLVQSLFIFICQIMMVDLIPIDGLHSNTEIWGPTYHQAVQWIENYNHTHPNDTLPIYNIQDVIKSANSFVTSLSSVVIATVMWTSQGAGVIYSRALGRKKYFKATNIYYECLILSGVFCVVMLAIMYGITRIWIQAQASAPHNYDTINNPLIQQYYKTYSETSINWATHYFFIYLITSFLQAYTLIGTYFLVAEGRNNIPTIITVVAQVLGLVIAFLLIYVARMGMNGGAVSIIIVYVINVALLMVYIYRLEKKQLTCLNIKVSHHLIWEWKEVKQIIYMGLGNFGKNISIAFLTSFSLEILNGVNASINGPSHALFYSSVYGIVLPIYSLMYATMAGIVRSSRSVCSYVYGIYDYKKVRESYWYTNLYTTIYSTLIFILIVFLLAGYDMPGAWGKNGPIILIFNLNYAKGPAQYSQVQYVLMIFMIQLPVFGFANAGMLFFQSTKKAFWNTLCSIMQGVIVLFPTLFIMRAISFATHSVEPTLWVPAIDAIITSLLIGIISVTYMYTTFKKEEINTKKFHNEQLYKQCVMVLQEHNIPQLVKNTK